MKNLTKKLVANHRAQKLSPDKVMLPVEISQQILTVGEEYLEPKGGIGSVLYSYSNHFPIFNFVSSYKMFASKILIILYYLKACYELALTLYKNKEFRIIHIHGSYKGSTFRKCGILLLAKYVFRRKVIYHSHGSQLKLFYEESSALVKFFIKFLIEKADVIICLSKQWETFFKQNFAVKKIVILENIVERPQNKDSNKVKGQDPVNVLFLGKIGERKGVYDLLDVLKKYKNSFDGKMQFHIGGNGETEKLEKFIQTNKLESLVKFEGWVTGKLKDKLLNESDVYILPSYNEGLPISILEAMSYKLPVISTTVGGIPEIIKDNYNGFLITPGDKDHLYNSLKMFIMHPELIKNMGEKSSEFINCYYPESVIPRLTKIYENLLTQN